MNIRRTDGELLRKMPKDTISGGEPNGSDMDIETLLAVSRDKCIPVVRGLMALLLSMDFTCNVDLFIITCKVGHTLLRYRTGDIESWMLYIAFGQLYIFVIHWRSVFRSVILAVLTWYCLCIIGCSSDHQHSAASHHTIRGDEPGGAGETDHVNMQHRIQPRQHRVGRVVGRPFCHLSATGHSGW